MSKFAPILRSALVALNFVMPGAGALAADPGVGPDELVIGQNITLQGGKNRYGVEVEAGIESYLRAVNQAGGVHGRKIVLRTLDDENQASKAEANARQLIDSGVFILFGSIEGGPSTAVMKAAVEQKVPFFGPMAGSPELRRPAQPLVFPVRAEHREEFRALIGYGTKTGLKRVGFFHADSDTGRQHLENVRLASKDLGAEVTLPMPFKSDISDAQLDVLVAQLKSAQVEMVLNHGSPSVYERLLRKARSSGVRATFFAVNSGSTQMAESLGPLAHGMVFSQVMPSPWARKTEITREYQDAFKRTNPTHEFSYGSLEGYVTAKALVTALKLAGPRPTREGFVRALDGAVMQLGGLKSSYRAGENEGSTFVDLSIVTSQGKFLQ